VIYICYFASVMRKQVNYHPLISVYGPYGGRVCLSCICILNLKRIAWVARCHVIPATPT